MEMTLAVDVLARLRDGRHPATGAELPADDASQHPNVVRALFTVLEKADQWARQRAARPARFGQPWSADEDKTLTAQFEAGAAAGALARELERTRGAVQARLVLLGLVEPDGAERLR